MYKMPCFDLLNKVELLVRTGRYSEEASKSSKKVTRAASKHFQYKDGSLWRTYRGRLLQVVRSEEEVKEILTRYHDNNNHAGRERVVKEIMLMYYWVGVTKAVKTWVKSCAVCQQRNAVEPPEPPVQLCLAFGCDSSSYAHPELGFHRFPKEPERRRSWLALAQRDEGSLRSNSCLCSRHFEPSCFTLTDEGQLTPDAVPTINPEMPQEDEVPVTSDEDFLHASVLEDLLSTAAAAESTEPSFDSCENPSRLQEHQYCLPVTDPDCRTVQTLRDHKTQEAAVEPSFRVYNQIDRYLSHRIVPAQSKMSRSSLRRMSKRFGLIDGVLMYTRVCPPVRVPRSRNEVNSILLQFHDNQGHCGQGICQRKITKHFYWASMTHDVARWISSCHTCLNRTKRKWLRCSVLKCTNSCGPVERGLGLTFHKFPLHSAALLAQWLAAVGRPNWTPRLRSSVCSAHFTEDCYDRSGEKVLLHPDAVPSLLVHGDAASRGPSQPAVVEEFEHVYFAKYDAVELYLRRRAYPPGLNYVEKNTFRRFCKKFVIKDDKLHMSRGERVRLVLRSRQQVEAALVDYHNELNHLNVSKCLRLLNERYFWKTMRSDVVQWISSCSHCSRAKWRKPEEPEPGGSEALKEAPSIYDIPEDETDDAGENDAGEGGGSDADTERRAQTTSEHRLEACLSLRPVTPEDLHPRTPNAPFDSRLCSVRTVRLPQSEVQDEGSSSNDLSQGEDRDQPQDSEEISSSHVEPQEVQVTATTHRCITVRDGNKPAELPKTKQATRKSQTENVTRPRSRHGTTHHSVKRRRDHEVDSSAKRSCGLEPVVAPSTKPWPVFTVAGSVPAQAANRPADVDSSAAPWRSRTLQARTVIQQCSQAKVRIRPALDGADAHWAEIQDGVVVYVCFFHGATEDVIWQIARTLLTTKLFRRDSRHTVSVLDLPGSVLLIPQDSLLGEPAPRRRMNYKGGCEPWQGAQLLSHLASACRELMSGSMKCRKRGVKVEQGVYGQKQEMVLTSPEPLTILLEF